MKRLLELPREHVDILERITDLSHKILEYHENDNLPQFVLHHLGHDSCFCLQKAAYFIDNPDFNHLQGVAGFCMDDCAMHSHDLWNDVKNSNHDLHQSSFHNEVRTISDKSLVKNNLLSNNEFIQKIAHELGINSCECITWKMKHGNYGLLLFESKNELSPWIKQLFKNASSYLAFCPIS